MCPLTHEASNPQAVVAMRKVLDSMIVVRSCWQRTIRMSRELDLIAFLSLDQLGELT